MNKLVKENLVRGLPSKLFENDQTCVACQKGKQHRGSYKSKTENSISFPLHLLHMDLFDPTFVKSLMKKMYCLVVTDDYSRFTWVFFLATKDETSCILKSFITGIENLVDHKVKVIRCDNGIEFKNREMNQFYEMKCILRQFSVAKTPQQNGVAERRNKTLIEAARTMLADSKLPTTFWAEAVNTACHMQNRVLVVKPHNKTPYELFHGRTPTLSFVRPFGCPVTILNTIDYLGKFDGKADEGFFVGYSLNSKAFRATQSNSFDSVQKPSDNAQAQARKETKPCQGFIFANVLWTADLLIIIDLKSSHDDGSKPSSDDERRLMKIQEKKVNALKRFLGIKKDERGIVIRNKVRLVAQGYTQEEGINYDEVVAPVARIEIKEEVYFLMSNTRNLEDPDFLILYTWLKKALYGLHSSLLELVMKTLSTYCWTMVFQDGEMIRPIHHNGTKVDIYAKINIMAVQEIDSGCKIPQQKLIKTINGEAQLHALADGKKIIVTESSVRRDLQLADEKGVDCLPNSTIFEQLTLMGLVRAATIASSLEAEQDSGPRWLQKPMGVTHLLKPRFESVSKHSNDSLLARGNTLQSDKDRLKLDELMALCTTLQNRVLDLESKDSLNIMRLPKDLIRLDEEAALNLQAKFDEEERLAREKAEKEKEVILP
ncbi:putative ribonuclease H-like domain-containing protein [Tanacetum coccineum]